MRTSAELCHCECHYDSSIIHIMPCCRQCYICFHNVAEVFYPEHIKKCEEEQAKALALIKNKRP